MDSYKVEKLPTFSATVVEVPALAFDPAKGPSINSTIVLDVSLE